MSIESLKKQAARLAAYLGTNHRLNLKHASALEALAAVHGARNWQTLAAQSTSSAAGERDAPTPAIAGSSAQQTAQRPVSWSTNGMPLLVPSTQWHRHTIAYGSADDLDDWSAQHLAYCLENKIGGLFFAMAERSSTPAASIWEDGTFFFDMESTTEAPLASDSRPVSLNLLAGCTAAEAAHLLVGFVPTRGTPSAQIDRIRDGLEILIGAMLTADAHLAITTILHCLLGGTIIAEIAQRSSGPVQDALTAWSAAAEREPGGIQGLFAPLSAALAKALSSPFARRMFSPRTDALSAINVLEQGGTIVVKLRRWSEPAVTWSQPWMRILWLASSRRATATSTSRPATVCCIPELYTFLGPSLTPVLRQVRSTNVVMLVGSSDARVRAQELGDAALNTSNRLYLGQRKGVVQEELLRRLEAASSVLVTSDGVQF